MKKCVECQKKLSIVEGYRHPTKGIDYLLCSKCFDTIFESVEEFRIFVSPYIGFFNKETLIIDEIDNIRNNITKSMKKAHNKVKNLWPHKNNQNANQTISIIN